MIDFINDNNWISELAQSGVTSDNRAIKGYQRNLISTLSELTDIGLITFIDVALGK